MDESIHTTPFATARRQCIGVDRLVRQTPVARTGIRGSVCRQWFWEMTARRSILSRLPVGLTGAPSGFALRISVPPVSRMCHRIDAVRILRRCGDKFGAVQYGTAANGQQEGNIFVAQSCGLHQRFIGRVRFNTAKLPNIQSQRFLNCASTPVFRATRRHR